MATPAEILAVIRARDQATPIVQKFVALLGQLPAAAGPTAAAMTNISNALTGVAAAASGATPAIRSLNTAMNTASRNSVAAAANVGVLRTALGGLGGGGAASSVVALTSSLGGASNAASRASGIFADLRNKIKDFSFSALLAGSTLSAALTAPIAIAATAGYQFNEMRHALLIAAESLFGSADAANSLYKELRSLADLTPFSLENMIQGATMIAPFTKDVEELQTVMELVSAAAMSSGKITALSIDRIALAFSQMLAAGRLTGNELRQLTEANVDVLGALSTKLGKTKAEIRDMISEGEIGAKQALNAIAELLGPRFADLLSKFSTSLPAALSTTQDAFKELQALFQEPIEEAFSEVLLRIVPIVKLLADHIAALDPEVRKLIGVFALAVAAMGPILVMFSGLAILIGLLANPLGVVAVAFGVLATAAVAAAAAIALNVGGLRDALGPALTNLANSILDFAVRMSEYGAMLVEALADGMISAYYVLEPVIAGLAAILSFWLAPGSDPKFAPLSEWGKADMEQFLSGFAEADFSILEKLGKDIEGILGLSMATSSKEFAKAAVDVRMAIAGIISETRTMGSASDEAWGRLESAAGDAYDQIKEIANAYFEVERAAADVAAQQEEINRLTKEWDAVLAPQEKQLRAIDRELRKLNDEQADARLMEQIAQGKGDPRELELRRQQRALRDQIEDQKELRDEQLEAAKDELERRQEIESMAKSHLAILTGQVNAMREYNKLVQDAAKAEAGGGGAGGKGAAGKGFVIDEEKIRFATEKAQLLAKAMEDFAEAARTAGPRLGTIANNLERAFNKAKDMIAVLGGQPTRIERDVAGMTPEERREFEMFDPDWRAGIPSIGGPRGDLAVVINEINTIMDWIKAVAAHLKPALQELPPPNAGPDTPVRFGQQLGEAARKQFANALQTQPSERPNTPFGLGQDIGEGVRAKLALLGPALEDYRLKMEEAANATSEGSRSFQKSWMAVNTDILAVQAALGVSIAGFFSDVVVPAWTFITDLVKLSIEAIILGFGIMKDRVVTIVIGVFDAVKATFETIMSTLQTFYDGMVERATIWWDGIMKGGDALLKKITELRDFLADVFIGVVKDVGDALGDAATKAGEIGQAFLNAGSAIASFIRSLPGGGLIFGNPDESKPPQSVGGANIRGAASYRAGVGPTTSFTAAGGTSITVYPTIYNDQDALRWARVIARQRVSRQD